MATATADESDDSVDQPTNNVVPSFSFSGCGFLGVYHVGVAACLRDHTDVVRRREIKFAGASAGALVATTLLCDIDFGEMAKLLLEVAKAVRDKEQVDLAYLLRDLLNRYLPDDAHIRLSNRLYISVTVLRGLKGGLITQFHSKEHLIECLVASSFVPGFMGWVPPGLEGDDFVDLTDSVRPLTDLMSEKTLSEMTDSEESEQEESSEDEAKPKQNGHVRQEQTLSKCGRRSSLDTDSIWGVCASDDESDSSYYSCDDGLKEKQDGQESYLSMLLRLCFSGIQTTSHVVRHVPGASHLLDRMVPKSLSSLEGLTEAIMLEMMSNRYMALDGGFSDNIPCFDSNTITICPFSGESDICPRDLTALDFNVDLGQTSMHASEDNIFRLNHALHPMHPEMLLKLCEQGYNECLIFLHRKDLLSCRKHLMTRAAISSSPCNIGHAHCRCRLCLASDLKIRSSLSCVNCHQAKRRALNSVLPEDVRREFHKAISDYRHSHHRPQSNAYWNRLITSLWWCAERMYAGTVRLADLAMDFYAWLLRFWDNIACFAKFSILPMGKKRKLVRHVLCSLRKCIGAAERSRSRASSPCAVRGMTVCS